MFLKRLTWMFIMVFSITACAKPIVIAHRGASGYLPEHTLINKALAYAMRPDYIEQDVVMTKDDKLVILHDHYLDRVTNVAVRFPKRARSDGRYYAIDFTLKEIQSLQVTEGFTVDEKGVVKPNFPDRFPMWSSHFTVPTLEDEIELIQGLNKTLNYNIGIYPEIKAPWFHRHEGKDISLAVLKVLKKYGYTKVTDKIFLQSFDPNELKRIKQILMPQLDMEIKLIQLIAENSWNETMIYDQKGVAKPYDYNWMFSLQGMKKIATYADGIGPSTSMLVGNNSKKTHLIIKPLIKYAKQEGLQVHPFTFRAEKTQIPPYATDFNNFLDIFINKVKVDGVFSDFPDKVVHFLRKNHSK